ncbi:MAG: hypothetical protein QM802_21255 [Agriterribacter sp.]
MLQLISKVQYKNFETGEFSEKNKRGYDETIQLIEAFPWEEQRKDLRVNLTNPSVTLEGINATYLKLALFYNGKFVLHYFSHEGELYTKSFTELKDAYPYIQKYFSPDSFDLTDFKKEPTWFQYNLKHFVSQDFIYLITPKRIKDYLFSTTGFSLAFGLLIILFIVVTSPAPGIIAIWLFVVIVMFFMGGGINLILFFNYYDYSKNKMLVMSKGNDVFFFGNKDSPIEYNKKDILRFISVRSKSSKSPVAGFGFIIIELRNGKTIRIPNIFVDSNALENKLFEYPKIEKNIFPFMRNT